MAKHANEQYTEYEAMTRAHYFPSCALAVSGNNAFELISEKNTAAAATDKANGMVPSF
jgi:hypothetical protein